MRAALSAVTQRFRDVWNLPWRLKGPFLGVLVVIIGLAVTLTVVVATGGDGGDSAVRALVRAPSPTATIAASPTPTPSAPTPKPTPKPSPTPEPQPSPPPPPPPSPPALEPTLTAAEVTECEFGQFDGWDDAFNLRPRGFTAFPASLAITADPIACEALWLAAYDDGYSRGTNDICSIVSDYIEVASPDELEFCTLEPPPPQPAPIPAEGVVESCIDGAFTGWSGDTVFELCNGQVWVQSSYAYTYHYAYRPSVTIVPTGSGYQMFVEGVSDSVFVTRVTDFIRTCIDGDFEGWEGDTVFVLCNGQIWQQTSFAYRYHYAYRPDVLIYQTGFGYRMKVDGVDDTITVVQLQ